MGLLEAQCQGAGEKLVIPMIHSVPSGKVYQTSFNIMCFGSFFSLINKQIYSLFCQKQPFPFR